MNPKHTVAAVLAVYSMMLDAKTPNPLGPVPEKWTALGIREDGWTWFDYSADTLFLLKTSIINPAGMNPEILIRQEKINPIDNKFSATEVAEIDCNYNRIRYRQIKAFAQHNLGGISAKYPDTNWIYITTGTVEEAIRRNVCQ